MHSRLRPLCAQNQTYAFIAAQHGGEPNAEGSFDAIIMSTNGHYAKLQTILGRNSLDANRR